MALLGGEIVVLLFFFVTVRHNFMIFFKMYTAVKPRILLESVNINDFVNRWKKMTVCDK